MLRRLFGSRRAEAERRIALGRESEDAGRLDEARRHYQSAVDAAPDHAPAQLNLGIALEAAGEREGAVRAFERALALDPREPYANYNLGRLLFLARQPESARARLEAALAARPDFPEALVVLADVLEELADHAGAETALKAAIAARPGLSGALRNYGALLGRQGRWAEAADALRRAADADPADAQALYELGSARLKLEQPLAALEAFREATERQPAFAEAWCYRGNLLADRGSRQEALDCFERALAIRPDYAAAHLGMGNVYGGVERLEEAAAHFRRAIELDPGLALARLNLGIVLSDQGLQGEALDSLRAALELDPGWPEARWALAMSQVPTLRAAGDDLAATRRRIAEALDGLERWCAANGGPEAYRAVGIQQPFWLAYQAENNRPLLAIYGRLCARLMGTWQARRGPAPARGGRVPGPLRVGIVSQYFRDHSVWHALLQGWFRALDRERFALHAFCLDPQADEATRYARSRAASFEQGHIGLESWVEAIERVRPDVLIYPEVGMDPLTLRLASLRLAPLQAASWGHPETTGLPTLDAYLSAQGLEPAEGQDHYSEALVRLANLGCCLEPRSEATAAPDLARLGIEPGMPLLVSPGTPFKYAPENDWILPEIARRLGECRLVLFRYRGAALARAFEARLRQAFAARDVDFDRHAVFVPWQAKSAFHGLLAGAHVFLDTIGFSGFNTALQAVECGLPVVTVEGRFLRGRLASGILRHLELDELVAADAEGYIERAVRLAADAAYRDALRRRMAEARPRLYGDLEPIRGLERFLAQGV